MERKTNQRTAIREAFRAAARPLGPQEVLDAAQDEVPSLGIATVYRNIKALIEEGWLQTVDLPGEAARYELADIGHHHHFHCKSCGKVFDIEGCPGKLQAMLPEGFELDDHEIVLYGRCADCSA